MNHSFQEPAALEIHKCHERIKTYIRKTSLISKNEVDEILGFEVFFKCENEQMTGAFKARGALNAVLQLSQNEIKNGLVTHSSGNHAQALAYAGNIRKAKTWVVMPRDAPKIKIEKVSALGSEIIFCQNTPEERQKKANEIVKKYGATFIHPFDNSEVITGQATVAKEILEEKSSIDTIVAPVGGGGLLSGTSLSAQYFGNNCRVYGAEPQGAADAVKSFASGEVEHADFVDTIADGLLTHLSEQTLNIIRKHVQDIWLVSENEIRYAMKFIYEHLNIIIEPSAAVSFAALLNNKHLFKGKKVSVILTGGNIDKKSALKHLQS